MHNATLYLASASPRRHEILKQLLIPHSVINPPSPDGQDEPQLPNEAPHDYVRRTAREKAERAIRWIADDGNLIANSDQRHFYVLGADTTVILDNEILGKPNDKRDAAATLKRLSGREHYVHTAVALYDGNTISETISVSTVQFKQLSTEEITTYCETDEPMGKAGAYGIQGLAAGFVAHLSGSYTGVMGLPAYETTQLLSSAGFNWP